MSKAENITNSAEFKSVVRQAKALSQKDKEILACQLIVAFVATENNEVGLKEVEKGLEFTESALREVRAVLRSMTKS